MMGTVIFNLALSLGCIVYVLQLSDLFYARVVCEFVVVVIISVFGVRLNEDLGWKTDAHPIISK